VDFAILGRDAVGKKFLALEKVSGSFYSMCDRLWNDTAPSDAEMAKLMPLIECEVLLTDHFNSLFIHGNVDWARSD
jgi:hypothetical protein